MRDDPDRDTRAPMLSHTLIRRTVTRILGLAAILLAGCASLDEKQGAWTFQSGDRTWDG